MRETKDPRRAVFFGFLLNSRLQNQTLALARYLSKSTDPDYRPLRRVILTLGTVWNLFLFAKSASLGNILFDETGDHALQGKL